MSTSFITMALGLMEFAPVIAKLVSGEKAQHMAERIVETAQEVTGSHDVVHARQALQTSSETVMRFQQALNQLVVQDRSDARQRDTSLFQLGKRNLRSDIMVLSALLGLMGCLAALTVFKMSLSGEVIGIISTIAGIFGSCLKDAYAFEFGSSRGSKEKETRLIELLTHSINKTPFH